MKEIVIISGKGGTGKTSITASFAMLGGQDVIVGDCDVDAADMHLLLKPDFAKAEDFYSGELAVINHEDCINCGICKEKCRFDAIQIIEGQHWIDPINCEGCGYCSRVCASNAIQNIPSKVGKCYISKIKSGSTMVHAKLGIGADNSGKLVAKVKNEAKKIAQINNKEIILIDGSPGIGCPVVSSLSGANFVVLVTEPSVSGLHDLKRVYQLVKKFHINAGCIINKYDINTDISTKIEKFLNEENILHISNIPYNLNFTKSMTNGQCITEYNDEELKIILADSWTKILETVNN